MRTLILAAVLALSLTACANSGVIATGKDTYTISVRSPFSGPSGAKGDALKEANVYCAKLNKHVLVKNEHSSECMLHGGCGEAEVTFMCLSENDARYSDQH